MNKQPFLWLQDNEHKAKATCGCKLVQEYQGSGAAFFLCKAHDDLTPSDWAEIYYALDSKYKGVLDGEYGQPRKPWAKHLKRIMKKIGPDGTKMY